MIGKNWLRNELSKLGELHLTNGGDTSNKRIDWNIDKSHSNDAICITDLEPHTIDLQNYVIKPMRRRSKATTDSVFGIKHRDLIHYSARTGKQADGYVTALYPKSNQLNFRTSDGVDYKKVSAKSCKILWRFSKIYWMYT